MPSVGTYAHINAKVRAMKSLLLEQRDFDALAASESLSAFADLLAERLHIPPSAVPEQTSPSDIETAITQRRIETVKSVLKQAKGIVREVITRFLEKDECENIKSVMRQWHAGKQQIKPLYPFPIVYEYEAEAAAGAKTILDAAAVFQQTPFFKALTSSAPHFEKKGNLFPVELALDRTMYQRLFDIARQLPKNDRRILQKIIGVEVDLRNVLWLKRLNSFYELTPDKGVDFCLPGGYCLKREDLLNVTKNDDALGILANRQIVSKEFTEKDITSYDLEAVLHDILEEFALSGFKSFPFSIGAVAGYIMLLKIEETRLIRTLYTVAFALDQTAQQSREP